MHATLPLFPRAICDSAIRRNILDVLSKRVFQFAAVLVLLFATLTPLANCFDTWDKNPAPANDTEMHVAAWFAGAGMVLVIAKTLRPVPVPTRRAAPMHSHHILARADHSVAGVLPDATDSPPLIPLRI